MELRYGDGSVRVAVDLALVSQADDHAHVRIRPKDVHEVASPEVETGTLDAEGRLVVHGDRLVGVRRPGGYEPRYLVGADRAGDQDLLAELQMAEDTGPVIGGDADAAVRGVERSGLWTRRLLAANAALSGLIVLAGISGGVLGEDPDGTIDLLVMVSGLQSIVLLATIVSWCVWQYRTHRAAEDVFGVQGMRSSGWAIGSWLVPFANLVVPYRAVRDLWKAADPQASEGGWVSLDAPALLAWWWAAWLSSGLLSGIAAQGGGQGLTLTMVSELLSIAAAILAIRIVDGIVERMRAKLEAASQSGV